MRGFPVRSEAGIVEPVPDRWSPQTTTVVLKSLRRRPNVAKIEAGPKSAVIAFSNPDGLIAFIRECRDAKVRPDMKLVLLSAHGTTQGDHRHPAPADQDRGAGKSRLNIGHLGILIP